MRPEPRPSKTRAHVRRHGLAVLLVFLTSACSEPATEILFELVPNPEVNTRAQVQNLVNRQEIVLDAEGGFIGLDGADRTSWGPYDVEDVDDDGELELILQRPGERSLEPFGIDAGRQGQKILWMTALGYDAEGATVAQGRSTVGFTPDERSNVEVPFNLVSERRSLRVIAMSPAVGSVNAEGSVVEIAIQLNGEVEAEALDGHVSIEARTAGETLLPPLEVSYVTTDSGTFTRAYVRDCFFTPGSYAVLVDADVESLSGQRLDQHLGLDGAQGYEGVMTISGEPDQPTCSDVEIMVELGCDATLCPTGYRCDGGSCVLDVEIESVDPEGIGSSVCDPDLCTPPFFVCASEACVADCRLDGFCADPSMACGLDTGLCSSP